MPAFNRNIVTEHTNGVENGVNVAPSSGINVLVVGAGVGGLAAALECHRKGQNVRIWERSSTASAGGDMFTIGLSGRRWIKHYPAMDKELDEISVHDGWMRYRKWSGEDIGEAVSFSEMTGGGGNGPLRPDQMPMVSQLRPLWHAMLYHQVERFGIEVSFDKRVVEYYEDEERGVGGVITDSGEHAEADIVIAADGLHSHSSDVVLGGQEIGKPSGRSIFRAAFPLETAMEDPLVASTFGLKEGKDPLFQGWLGPDTHCMILSYVDKHGGNGQLCWGLTFKEEGEQDTTESWNRTASNTDVLKVLDRIGGWGEAMKALVRKMPEGSIIFWPLLWRNPNPCVHSKAGRVVQIGDAAHSFLPSSGNGATQAIEDGITIAACLQHAGGKEKVPEAVKTHSLLRSDRVSCAQLLGFYNSERWQKTDMKKVGSDPSKVSAKVPKWIFTSDPEKYANENYGAAAASLREDGPAFKNTNIPVGYEPQPWTLESIDELERQGKTVELSGDWS